ncbi:MAG: GHKL domain-containing protein [Clostridia bacterium]|nr:GHKL domain-containing protein [Clostridia bacterium]
MRIDLGLVSAIIIEYIAFIVYADTLFYRKRNRYACYLIIAIGYLCNMVSCMYGNVFINNAVSCSALFLSFKLCYRIDTKTALFQSALLVVVCACSEILVLATPMFEILTFEPLYITPIQSLILTVLSRTMYVLVLMIMSRILSGKRQKIVVLHWTLSAIPILSNIIITWLIKERVSSVVMLMSCVVIMVANIIVFILNQQVISKEYELSELKSRQLNEKVDFEEYMLLKERYQNMQIFHHDFRQHMNTLNSLIKSDNEQAKEYINQFSRAEEISQFTEYSDNKILNILLSKIKVKCEENGIKFIIDPISASLSFIKDMDTVTIFSNLLNNAIEGCNHSKEKAIFMNITTQNEIFTVIKLDNTSENKPIVIDGKLKTHKANEKLHGIGMSSIKRALKDYEGSLTWTYDEKEKIFSTVIVMKNT